MKDKSFKIFVSCDEACYICDKSQYHEASWWQRLKLSIHIMYCKKCNAHSKKNTKLTTLCDEAKLQDKTLKQEEKEKMKKLLSSQKSK